jgi:hypothetical protein
MTVSKIFIDTAPLIYILDMHPEFGAKTQKLLRDLY